MDRFNPLSILYMYEFIYFGSAKVFDIIDEFTDRLVDAGDNSHLVSCKLIPTSITSVAELAVWRKRLVSKCALGF